MDDVKGRADGKPAASEADEATYHEGIRDPGLQDLARRMEANADAAEETARRAWALANSLPTLPRPVRS